MKDYQEYITRLHQNLCYIRDPEIRRRGKILLAAMRAKNFKKTAISYGISRKTLYDWLRKLKAANFDVTALKSKSRRPNNSPNKTPEHIEDLVVKIAQEFGNSDRTVADRLCREHGYKLSHSTIYAILKRRKVLKKYRTRNIHT
ncbi:MAG: helix-turn-helix domain-containing protein [Turneriella sp.]|nr:helix-turn-helix domain-containing protein [Turneriella sp.]